MWGRELWGQHNEKCSFAWPDTHDYAAPTHTLITPCVFRFTIILRKRLRTQYARGECSQSILLLRELGKFIIYATTNGYSSLHSLKVTHLLSLVVVLTQQCTPSGLLCVGPQDRTNRVLTLVISWSPVATSSPPGTVVPSGNCHSTLLVFVVKQSQGRGGG